MKVLAAAAVALMVAGCAHAPVMKQEVNRAAKADKLVVKKAEQPTPNQTIKKRWYDGFRVRWLHR